MSNDKSIIFFDGVCGLCNHFVDFIIAVRSQHQFRFAPLQGETAKMLLPQALRDKMDSVVLYENRQIYRETGAIARIFFKLTFPYKTLGFLIFIIPSPIRNFVYREIAVKRYEVFGKKETCRLPLPHEQEFFLN